MRKLLVGCIVILGLSACNNNISAFSNLKNQVQQSLWHSVFDRVTEQASDTAALPSAREFNFFLRDGIAQKFGF